jgi:hypothetical protein|tara:strand:+ start:2794 stop:3168 length:375 start_codon:yes stop_codon:yes gene_type:complete
MAFFPSFNRSRQDPRLGGLLSMMGVGVARTVNGYTIATTDVVPHNISAAGGVVELNLPTSAAWSAANPNIPFIRISAVNIANAATVDPDGSEFINGLGGGNVYTFATAFDSIDLYPVSGGWNIR